MVRFEKGQLCAGLAEVQAYARVETGEEEALLAGLLRVASELCETFIAQPIMVRGFEQELRTGQGWTLIGVQPVRTITEVRLTGEAVSVPTADYQLDIDHDGRAFLLGLTEGRAIVVTGTAGLADEPNQVPEPIRQGILRLAASLFANRDAPIGDLPSAVTALWRPYRRAGLCL